jgi:hypothetical protein
VGQLQRWKEFFKEILNTDCPPYEEEEVMHSVPQLQISVRTPSKREVKYAIKSMKNGKAAGSDNRPPKIPKRESSQAADMLLPLFQEIWQEEIFPKEWKEGIVIKIPKRGDLS